jgi:hypothetical protein
MKSYQYGILILALAFLGYHSVYFEKLSEVRAQQETEFDFSSFADSLYYQGMLTTVSPVDLGELLTAIRTDQAAAFERYGNRLGIGNSAYFMVQCQGIIREISEDEIVLQTEGAGAVLINTRYIFGNALRDASGLVKLTDFKTNAEFNKVSEALNALIRTKVIPPVVQQLEVGDEISVSGAVKLSRKESDPSEIVLTPAQINPR